MFSRKAWTATVADPGDGVRRENQTFRACFTHLKSRFPAIRARSLTGIAAAEQNARARLNGTRVGPHSSQCYRCARCATGRTVPEARFMCMNTSLMKALSGIPCLLLTLLAAALPPVHAATIFTTDTLIGVNDTTHEGQDIVVSNAVLTVDGAHTFNSVRVTAGGMLTHSASATGMLPYIVTITNELQVLTDTNSVILVQPGIILNSVIVTDTNHLVIYTNDVDYVLTNAGVSVTLQRTTNSAIPDGGTVSVYYDYQTTVPAGLNLNVTTDVEIEPGASVNADARGFGGGSGLGAGASSGSPLSGGGGGYGGYGGLSSSNGVGGTAYGSPVNALMFGSGGGGGVGGPGGAGGGAIRLAAGNNVVLNGTVTVNGQGATNSRAGGGSGGRIYVNARTISGGGTVSAVGGPGEPIHGGGGGGGRIQLDAWTNNFTGAMLANGGAGWQRGGAGTISI